MNTMNTVKWLLAGAFLWTLPGPVVGHEIYTGLKDKRGSLCCGGNDCFLTTYREQGDHYEFLTKESVWVALPQEAITFLPIPGDPPHDDSHAAHLCYRLHGPAESQNDVPTRIFGPIFLYCAFIPPGSI